MSAPSPSTQPVMRPSPSDSTNQSMSWRAMLIFSGIRGVNIHTENCTNSAQEQYTDNSLRVSRSRSVLNP
mgnify:CR=1 FL=1